MFIFLVYSLSSMGISSTFQVMHNIFNLSLLTLLLFSFWLLISPPKLILLLNLKELLLFTEFLILAIKNLSNKFWMTFFTLILYKYFLFWTFWKYDSIISPYFIPKLVLFSAPKIPILVFQFKLFICFWIIIHKILIKAWKTFSFIYSFLTILLFISTNQIAFSCIMFKFSQKLVKYCMQLSFDSKYTPGFQSLFTKFISSILFFSSSDLWMKSVKL